MLRPEHDPTTDPSGDSHRTADDPTTGPPARPD
jgi:hypothetical protein